MVENSKAEPREGTLRVSIPKEIGIAPWARCTAACGHCGQSSSPSSDAEIAHSRVLSMIREAGILFGDRWSLSLTGGELFCHIDRLCEYAGLAKEYGGSTLLVTNGFWGSSYEETAELLTKLKSNGLRRLGISTDRFHREFVPIEYILNIVKAADSLGIPTEIRHVGTKTDRLSKTVRLIQDSNVFYVTYLELSLVPNGRARMIPSDEFFYSDRIPSGPCVAQTLTMNYDGSAMICCNGAVWNDLLVGNAMVDSLENIIYAYKTSSVALYLRNNGPIACIDFLEEDEQIEIRREKYVNECHLCSFIFSDSSRAARIRTLIEELFISGAHKAYNQQIPGTTAPDFGVV